MSNNNTLIIYNRVLKNDDDLFFNRYLIFSLILIFMYLNYQPLFDVFQTYFK